MRKLEDTRKHHESKHLPQAPLIVFAHTLCQRFKQKFKAFGVTWLVKRPSDVRSAGRLQLDNKVVPPMTCQSSEPPDAIQQHDRRADSDPRAGDSDENRIASAMKDLKNTGWYWGSLTAHEAKEILHDAPEGTFLVRDSSQRDYLFTISAMTSAGPTNLRIEFKDGKFKLDSVVLIKPKLRQFDSVVLLVEHYVQLSRNSSKAGGRDGAKTGGGAAAAVDNPPAAAAAVALPPAAPSGTVQLLLTKPVYTAAPALQHLCRVSINRSARSVRDLPLPNRLKDYLTDYAFNV
ncbi:suppressor of cytokine signaling 2 [Gadus chalcogrammus]|uniref:suppressor of cytokine signaling 2 n=1 Tax=Gadus chalcogrammus TaxID=1042646 RepID=UPI0024C32DBB|nr:suppressor of cytokine signaling 2 [Gadus chalcogrammus]